MIQRSTLLIFLACWLALPVVGQKKPLPNIERLVIDETRQTPRLVTFDQHQPDAPSGEDERQILQAVLELRNGQDELKLLNSFDHGEGVRFHRYQQYYQGIKVIHGQYTSLLKDDRLAVLNGAYYAIKPDLSTLPALTEAVARDRALDFVAARRYFWEEVIPFTTVFAPPIAEKAYEVFRVYFPEGELVIVDDFRTEAADPRLAWRFNIYASEPLSRDWVYVDAQTGQLLLRDAIIKHGNTPVETRYSGTRQIETAFREGANPNLADYPFDTDGYFILQDLTRGSGVETYDMNGIGGLPLSVNLLYDLATDFVDDDDDWTRAEHVRDPAPTAQEAINDDIAWDAHWGAEMVYDYWLERHGRNSWDGNGAKIRSYVHYGEGYDNAFWNGSVMTYGDGSYKNVGGIESGSFSPLTSVDVCAHEIGHAVCETTSNLVYQRESGAMNEGFSDIWAACVENYVIQRFAGDAFDYRPFAIGEQIDQRSGFNNLDAALRWMDDPKQAGDPDTYGGENWLNPECGEPTLVNDYCGVHTNSGVLNKWFYLLTVGSGMAPDDGVNDLGNAYLVNGLGFSGSELIAFGAEVMLSPTATFAEARDLSIAYARAQFGPCSPEEVATTNAWFAVGVGDAFTCDNSGPASIGFTEIQGATSERAPAGGGCDAAQIITAQITVNVPVSFNLQLGGTATPGVDYQLLTPVISHDDNLATIYQVGIELFDDTVPEGDETIVLTIPLGVSPLNGFETYTLLIKDDDVPPAIGIGPVSLLYERFLTTDLPTGWEVVTQLASLNQWTFGSVPGTAFISATGGAPNYEGNNSETTTILRSPLLDARGLTGISVSFDWEAGGETDVSLGDPVFFDYGALVYSYDGVTFFEVERFVGDNFGATPAGGVCNQTLTFLDNQQFYLGWKWRNDALLGTGFSFSVDNIRVNGDTRRIEQTAAQSGEARLGPFQTIFFYSQEDGELLARIANNSDHDYGCTTVAVETGSGSAAPWYNGCARTGKSLRIEPAVSAGGNDDLEVTLYFTESELGDWENSTGRDREELRLFRTTAATIGDAHLGNTSSNPTSYDPITPITLTIGGAFTATFHGLSGGYTLSCDNSGSNAFAANGGAVIPDLSQRRADWQAYPNPARDFLQIDGLVGYSGTLRLLNAGGIVLEEIILTEQSGPSHRLEVGSYPAGVYLLVVQTEGQSTTRRIILQ